MEIVYLSDGRKAELIASMGGKYLVRPLVRDEQIDEEFPSNYIIEVSRVFDAAPTWVYPKTYTDGQAQIQKMYEELRNLRTEKAELESDVKKLKEAKVKCPSLGYLFDYIDGKYTHVLALDDVGYGEPKYTIHKISDYMTVKDSYSSYRKPKRALSLVYDRDNKLTLVAEEYSDRSGTAKGRVVFLTAEEEGWEYLDSMYNTVLKESEITNGEGPYSFPPETLLNTACSVYQLPKEYKAFKEAKKAKNLEAQKKKLEEQLVALTKETESVYACSKPHNEGEN